MSEARNLGYQLGRAFGFVIALAISVGIAIILGAATHLYTHAFLIGWRALQ